LKSAAAADWLPSPTPVSAGEDEATKEDEYTHRGESKGTHHRNPSPLYEPKVRKSEAYWPRIHNTVKRVTFDARGVKDNPGAVRGKNSNAVR
jgi:hypothetical protein